MKDKLNESGIFNELKEKASNISSSVLSTIVLALLFFLINIFIYAPLAILIRPPILCGLLALIGWTAAEFIPFARTVLQTALMNVALYNIITGPQDIVAVVFYVIYALWALGAIRKLLIFFTA